ncbi:IS3 family transposase [Corynebacterium sp. KPL1818]|uniref:IS3 family transposase n=1 Tax=Corynebacterium sp. KPL1818 TaxID=1203559 RepID=UPI0009FD66E8
MYSDAVIGARIATIFDDEHGLYGAKRIAASLNEDTAYAPINHKKVARIMKAMGLRGFTKRRRCITTRRKDLTPVWWTPDIQPSRAGRKVIYHHVQVLRTVQTRCRGPLRKQ